jgi:RNA polymerase-binding protein DksA
MMTATDRKELAVDLEVIKQDLEARKRDLLDRHGRITRHTRHREAPLSQDFAEQAVELENQELLEALDQEVAEEIRRIQRALVRIDNGDYETCISCGNDIGEARLKALPTTSRCVECAAEAERR